MKKKTDEEKYKIPIWCNMSLEEHRDGMGGCWGISSGLVAKNGKDHCDTCEYYNKKYNEREPVHTSV